jgi:bifunctional DNA-binding transcriptional regulator/antitoxin component of YhaV-PrlF toxin-antitoxin module
MDSTVQVDEQGAITLPSEVCAKYGIETGDTLRLIDCEGIFALTTISPVVAELAQRIEQLREEAGLSIDELLKSLREERERQ